MKTEMKNTRMELTDDLLDEVTGGTAEADPRPKEAAKVSGFNWSGFAMSGFGLEMSFMANACKKKNSER